MALVSMQAFYNKMGEELLILLPETILYLSELLEGGLIKHGITTPHTDPSTL